MFKVKALAVLFLTFSLSAASSEQQEQSSVDTDRNLLELLFNNTTPRCTGYPNCEEGESEQEQMELLEDLEKQAPPAEDNKQSK